MLSSPKITQSVSKEQRRAPATLVSSRIPQSFHVIAELLGGDDLKPGLETNNEKGRLVSCSVRVVLLKRKSFVDWRELLKRGF